MSPKFSVKYNYNIRNFVCTYYYHLLNFITIGFKKEIHYSRFHLQE